MLAVVAGEALRVVKNADLDYPARLGDAHHFEAARSGVCFATVEFCSLVSELANPHRV